MVLRLAVMLQESAYAAEDYQAWRSELVGECFKQVQELNTELIAVRLRMQSVGGTSYDTVVKICTASPLSV